MKNNYFKEIKSYDLRIVRHGKDGWGPASPGIFHPGNEIISFSFAIREIDNNKFELSALSFDKKLYDDEILESFKETINRSYELYGIEKHQWQDAT